MSKIDNKIDANDRTIHEVLNERKYTVDYFQREYSWEQKHIEQLVSDLTTSFLREYSEGDSNADVADYNGYYMGPFVVSEKDGKRSIIDGQQRLTSITLLLIYLNNRQKEIGITSSLSNMVFSEKFGQKSFNIQVEERTECLNDLFNIGEYTVKDTDDESTVNMANRYNDIVEFFPEEIKGEAFVFFLDWLKYKVVFVEIVAYSDENAYTIFETMNDRGLNLTPTEMLKGFLLSRFKDESGRKEANTLWKECMQELHNYDKEEDQKFVQSWLRSQYAQTIRSTKKGALNEDFEKIGTRFHSWVRENPEKVGLDENKPELFENFISKHFVFYFKAYKTILESQKTFNTNTQYIYYIQHWGIAISLSYPLMLAPLTLNDSDEVIKAKMDLVAKYLETYVVKRSINYRKFGSSSIRYTMSNLVKEIRSKSLDELKNIFAEKVSNMEESWDKFSGFGMHGQNKAFVKFLLSRVSSYIDQKSGIYSSFSDYFESKGKPFEIEHIWANKYERHTHEFSEKTDFEVFRNRIGDLVLLPRGTNQSYGDKPYDEKQKHYVKENLLVQSLTPLAYQNNPNFLNMVKKSHLPFKHHDKFEKVDIEERQALYQSICEQIWNWNES